MKPDIGRESRFLPTPPAFDATVRGVPIGILLQRLVPKNWNDVASAIDGETNLMFIRFNWINERDIQTGGQTPHDGIGRAYAQHRAAKKIWRWFSSSSSLNWQRWFASVRTVWNGDPWRRQRGRCPWHREVGVARDWRRSTAAQLRRSRSSNSFFSYWNMITKGYD